MKKFLCIAIISLMTFSVQGQPQGRAFERVHAAKVAYITDRIQLTTKQSERFWPVYNDFEKDRIAIRKKYYNADKGTNQDRAHGRDDRNDHGNYQDGNEGDARQSIEDNLDFQQEELDLKKRYSNEFMKIISAQQLSLLYKAEREFRQLLMQRLKERRGHGNGHGGGNGGGDGNGNGNWR